MLLHISKAHVFLTGRLSGNLKRGQRQVSLRFLILFSCFIYLAINSTIFQAVTGVKAKSTVPVWLFLEKLIIHSPVALFST